MKNYLNGFIVTLSFLLSGCLAAPLVATVGGEYFAEGTYETYKKTGKEISAIANWEKTEAQSTITVVDGKQYWLCSDALEEKLDRREEFRFVCIDKNISLTTSKDENFVCTEGKGVMLGVLNKNNLDTIYCKKSNS